MKEQEFIYPNRHATRCKITKNSTVFGTAPDGHNSIYRHWRQAQRSFTKRAHEARTVPRPLSLHSTPRLLGPVLQVLRLDEPGLFCHLTANWEMLCKAPLLYAFYFIEGEELTALLLLKSISDRLKKASHADLFQPQSTVYAPEMRSHPVFCRQDSHSEYTDLSYRASKNNACGSKTDPAASIAPMQSVRKEIVRYYLVHTFRDHP